jgi:integrase
MKGISMKDSSKKKKFHTVGISEEAWKALQAYRAKQKHRVGNNEITSTAVIYYTNLPE